MKNSEKLFKPNSILADLPKYNPYKSSMIKTLTLIRLIIHYLLLRIRSNARFLGKTQIKCFGEALVE
jgi:hypothetical protein